MSSWLCSDTHISVIADAVIRVLPSRMVIEYILKNAEYDMSTKTLPTAVGACLFRLNKRAMIQLYGEEGDVADAEFVYRAPTRAYTHPEVHRAVSSFCYQGSIYEDDPDTRSTFKLMQHLQMKLEAKSMLSAEDFREELENVDTWCIDDEETD